ncbi:MAG: long-chain fatty acid--CoA ligase [Candidatus Eremiobacterales bacterium]
MTPTTSTNDGRDAQTRSLDEQILRFIASQLPSDAEFDRLALACFAYQYERCEPYRRLCDRIGRSPRDVSTWLDVPAVQSTSFAIARLACFPRERTAVEFHSSGTTTSGERASTLELDSPALYEASLLAHFQHRILPDFPKMRILALVPSRADAPNSSLSYMAAHLIDSIGAAGSGFFMVDGQLAFEELRDALARTEPAIIFGTAFAFVHLFDRCRANALTFRLPPGSRVVETGGFKGRSREVPRAELYAAFTETLGVPRDMCASEYGMCELGSQWYDTTIQDGRYDVKVGPHWAKAIVVDPVTAQPVEPGADGLIRIFDLSNRGSVCALVTGDLGVERDRGFLLLGRSVGAPPKGCSIEADELLTRGRG